MMMNIGKLNIYPTKNQGQFFNQSTGWLICLFGLVWFMTSSKKRFLFCFSIWHFKNVHFFWFKCDQFRKKIVSKVFFSITNIYKQVVTSNVNDYYLGWWYYDDHKTVDSVKSRYNQHNLRLKWNDKQQEEWSRDWTKTFET